MNLMVRRQTPITTKFAPTVPLQGKTTNLSGIDLRGCLTDT